MYTEEEVKHRIDVVASAMKYLDKEQVLAASVKEWEVLIGKHDDKVSTGLAPVVKALLGNAAPDILLSCEA